MTLTLLIPFSLDNMGGAQYIIENWTIMAIISAPYAVDTFFFIGGLLVCYLGLKFCAKSKGKINIPLMYVQRYSRLVYSDLNLFLTSLLSS